MTLRNNQSGDDSCMRTVHPAAAVGLAAATSRVLGYVRDVLLASVLGAGPAGEAFLAALRLPDTLRRILGDGGFNSVLTPLHIRLRQTYGEAVAAGFARDCIVISALILSVLAGMTALGASAFIAISAPGLIESPEAEALARRWFVLMAPFMGFTSLGSIVAAFLNAERRFIIPALAPATMNVVLVLVYVIVATCITDTGQAGTVMAAGLSMAGLTQLALTSSQLAPFLLRAGSWLSRLSRSSIRKALAIMTPAMVATASIQLASLAAAAIASGEPGALAWFYYAERLFALPLSLGGAIISSIVLTDMSERHAGPSGSAAPEATLEKSLCLTLAWSLPAAVGLAILAAPIVDVLYRHGAFLPEDAAATATILASMAPGLPAAMAARVLQQQLLVRGNAWEAASCGLLAVAATVIACTCLMATWKLQGLGHGVAIGLWTFAGAMSVVVATKHRWRPSRTLGALVFRQCIAAAIMGGVITMLSWGVADAFSTLQTLPRLLLAVMTCVSGAAIYGAVAWRIGAIPRLADDNQLFRRKRT